MSITKLRQMLNGMNGMSGVAIDILGGTVATVAVAATNWGDASSPIWSWSNDEKEWHCTECYVSDFHYNPHEALAAMLSEIISNRGGPSETELRRSGWYDWDDDCNDDHRAQCYFVADWLVDKYSYDISNEA